MEEITADPSSGYIFDKIPQLTTDQQLAVVHRDGPLLVVAGAGTGKTLCIARRVAHLIKSEIASTQEVLVLTFSNRAAQEMEERIDLLLPYAFSDIWVSTFHSFGRRILARHAIEAGITPNFQVLTPQEQGLFLRENLFQLPLNILRPPANPTHHIRALIRLISRLKDEDISPEEYQSYAVSIEEADEASRQERALHLEMAGFYRAYQALMTEKGYLDMSDLVYQALNLLRENPIVADRYMKQFKYILVDEFQDTNHAQYMILKLLCRGHRNITVVGDDDQSIYKFRGAAISNILNFIEDFPGARQVVLRQNFRSAQVILDSAYRLIRNNNPYRLEVKNNINKQLTSRDDPAGVVSHRIHDTLQSQGEALVDLINTRVSQGYDYSQIAVLIRANRDAEMITRQFNLAGIPYYYPGSSGLYQRPEVRSLISFFRVLSRPDDSLSLYYLTGSSIIGLSGRSLTRLSLEADNRNMSLGEVMELSVRGESKTSLDKASGEKVKLLMGLLGRFREDARWELPGRILYQFLKETGYLGRLGNHQEENPEEKTRNIALFFDIISRFESVARYPLAGAFIDYLDSLMEAGDDPQASPPEGGDDAVQVLTIHKAKGLEFPVVIVAGIAEGNFPSRGRSDYPDLPEGLIRERVISPDFHIQEERRLFYVAMTRAKKELHLFGVRNFGGKRPRKISRFLMEALDRPISSFTAVPASPGDIIARHQPPPASASRTADNTAGEILHLTSRHFDDYLTCPLKYKYVHVMRLPVMQHHRVAYGRAVRCAALDFLRREKEDIPTTLEDIWEVLDREWTREGFLSQEHEKIRREEGKEAISLLFERFHREIESRDLVDRDYRFFLGDVHISGRWDMLRPMGESHVIIDLRASRVRDRSDANRKTRSSVKNRIGILAYREIFKTNPIHLESYFLESDITGILKPDEKWMEPFLQKIRDGASGIARGDHAPDPEYFKCSLCAYNEICPATATVDHEGSS